MSTWSRVYATPAARSSTSLAAISYNRRVSDFSGSGETGGRGVPLDRPRKHLRLHSVDVYVRDQERSVRFYLDKLGFELAFDARLHSGRRWVGVSPPDGTAVLTLIQPEPDSAECKLIGRATRVVFVSEDVAAQFREWSSRGVRFRFTPRLRRIKYQKHGPDSRLDGVDRAGAEGPIWGEVFTRFEDVDRNSFALVSFDEVTMAIEAQRRANAAKLEADRRVAYEMDIARQVQSRLFPQRLPICSTLEYSGLCEQARQVGGDYYDFLPLGEERVGLVVGDVAGKGIAAALLMANLQAHLRSQCAVTLDELEKRLRSVNRLFFENTAAGAYATLFFAEYDNRLQRLRYANCGHLCGLVVRHDHSVERLESTCTVLGLFTEWDCAIGECQLFTGDILALYTDGVTESFNEAGEEFGEERVLQSLTRHGSLSPEAMVRAILSDVRQFGSAEQHDDITLMIAKCRGESDYPPN
jgi:serine phosphatase RsbU (regulator of sigma subunit)/catechol 2,3-dioxygenase-like lactoylglutathione lyase family enzyme